MFSDVAVKVAEAVLISENQQFNLLMRAPKHLAQKKWLYIELLSSLGAFEYKNKKI